MCRDMFDRGLTAIVLIASIGTVHVAIASQFRCDAIARVAAGDERSVLSFIVDDDRDRERDDDCDVVDDRVCCSCCWCVCVWCDRKGIANIHIKDKTYRD